jgi:hypothetical protein
MLKHLLAAAALTASISGSAVAAEQAFAPRDNGQIEFTMPSGNIGCLYTPEGGTDTYVPAGGGPELICERVEPSYVTVILSDVDEAQVIEDPAEQSCCGAENIFEYGNTVELEGFECESTETGLICENDEGYGFSMARAGIELLDPDPEDLAEAEDDNDDDDV